MGPCPSGPMSLYLPLAPTNFAEPDINYLNWPSYDLRIYGEKESEVALPHLHLQTQCD